MNTEGNQQLSPIARTGNRKFLLGLLILSTLTVSAYCVRGYFSRASPGSKESRVSYYQDSMHPWIKSDHPGKCTICNMDLTPIHEGAKGFADENVVALGSNTITVLNVQTEQVKEQPLMRTLRVAGTLEVSETSKRVIAAGKAGRIERLAVPYAGFDVTEGERLANFFIPDLLAESRRYAMLARTGARGGQANEADLSNPLLGTLQNLRLFGLTDTQIESIAKTGKAEGSFELLAPVTGTVIERNVSEGEYVSEGARLFTIVDLSKLWFRFDVYEQDLDCLQVGQQVEFSVASASGQVFSGPITFIEPFVNDATRAAKVRVDVGNPIVEINGVKQRALRQQLYAEGKVRVQMPARLVIPSSAVLFPGAQAYAYVDAGSGAYELRQLKLGRRGDRHWEVLHGVEAGEAVVTTGNLLLDAQAQFNRGGPPAEANATELAAASPREAEDEVSGQLTSAEIPSLSPGQEKALNEFFAAADGISVGLAADDLGQLRPHVAALPGLVLTLEKELGDDHRWQPIVKRIRSASQWTMPASLEAAREAFLPFSTNVVELVEHARASQSTFRPLKVYRCPMAPKPGLWFQAKGPLRNPYFGAEMLTCGKEIPLPAPSVLAREGSGSQPVTVDSEPAEPLQTMAAHSSSADHRSAPEVVSEPVSVKSKPRIPVRPQIMASPRNFSQRERSASATQVDPIDSRDHSAFDNRMNDALLARFRSMAGATNRAGPSGPPMPAPGRQTIRPLIPSPTSESHDQSTH